MITKTKQQFYEEASMNRTVAVSASTVADTRTPIQLFNICNDEASFLLESKDPLSPWSNYSFIGLNPKYFLRDKGDEFIFSDKNDHILFCENNLQTAWDRAMATLDVSPTLPDIPFPGGAVGYLGFEGFRFYEPKVKRSSEKAHDASFMFCQTILAFDHDKEQLTIVHFQESERLNAYESAVDTIHGILAKIEEGEEKPFPTIPIDQNQDIDVYEGVSSNYTKDGFIKDVLKIKDYIAAGDVFQTVLSQRFEVPVRSDGLSLYRVLRKVNPSPYLYYIRFPDQEIIGSSPERLVKVDQDRHLEIHPIAGTRKRGKDKAEDEALAQDLLHDEKERAEHLMLVDLARNDIGRVSEYGSVDVHDMMDISYFSHVMHLTTKVTGILREDVHPFEALFSTHPAGTVSGAPKLRAVEIIQELENMHRGVYAGAIAYYGFNKAIDSCIAIRTIVLKDGKAYVQAGAGVVQDSIPELEYEETRNKARALLYAVKLAEQRLDKEEVMKR
ncbi:anthranilate synthase component I [Paenalkalicoccus suaedae]|uniref:Anthranilate synthase component 1 n=1 Tax=Paenalkalicoccus suaedae TaxID=2592382 RepID=A0A859FDE3_9BACI|nr:anthranilate synthase component I [Paenalkalicoccus suaedae]QKS71097.1 anthranilate synthase component I [Paenalkalicoccus suaedae]